MQPRCFDTLHQDLVHDAQFDFYGKRLATCSSDSVIKIWQVDADEMYKQVGEIVMHEGAVWQVSWAHPKYGSLLASCGYDKRVMVFRESSPGNWVRVFCYEGHSSSVNGISWAPPEMGLHLATASSDGKVTVLSHRETDDAWDVVQLEDKGGKGAMSGALAVSWAPFQPGTLPLLAMATCGGDVAVLELSEDGKHLSKKSELPCCSKNETGAVWVRDVAWCPQVGVPLRAGEKAPLTLAACTDAGKVLLFKTDAKGEFSPAAETEDGGKTELPSFPAAVWRLSWSSTGKLLSVSSGDNSVTLWKEDITRQWTQVCSAPVNAQ